VAYDMQTEMSSLPTGGLCLPASAVAQGYGGQALTCGYFNSFQKIVNKKMAKKALFLATEIVEKIQFTSKK